MPKFREYPGHGNRFVFVLEEAARVRAERGEHDRTLISKLLIEKIRRESAQFDARLPNE